MLVQAIPAYRLPREELDREVDMIAAMGVRFEYGKALGRDFTLKSLKDEGYEAVFLGVGAPQGMGIGVPGEDGPGVYDGLSFLKQYNLEGEAPVGKNVAIIGGGNAAIDAARTALRLGAETVRILYRRTRAQMPAWGEEIDAADLEGIDIMTLVAPQEILRDAVGNVTGVLCKEMALGDYDKSGRRRPVAGHNPDFVVEADTVIAAIGQKLDAPAILDGTPVDLDRWDYLAADANTGQTSIDWVFAGGDAATGPSSVVEAIGAGERAAVGVDEFLTGANHAFWRRDMEPPTFFDPDADPVLMERHAVEELSVAQRVTSFDEVELSWAARTAIAEAQRCLRCDYGKYRCEQGELKMPTLTIDDTRGRGPGGRHGPPGGPPGGREDPDPVLSRRRPVHRRLPHLPRRGGGRPHAGRLVQPAGHRRHGREDQHRQGARRPTDGPRADPLRARR